MLTSYVGRFPFREYLRHHEPILLMRLLGRRIWIFRNVPSFPYPKDTNEHRQMSFR